MEFMRGSFRFLLLGCAADAVSFVCRLVGLLPGLPVGVLRVHGAERIAHWPQDGNFRAQYRLPGSFEWCVTGPAHRYELRSSFRRLLVIQIPAFMVSANFLFSCLTRELPPFYIVSAIFLFSCSTRELQPLYIVSANFAIFEVEVFPGECRNIEHFSKLLLLLPYPKAAASCVAGFPDP